jgi:diguanylate cyclase (GGDEF)-like protein
MQSIPFDIRTLLAAVMLATAFCAGARVLLWRMHPAMPGLARWAIAGGLTALALIILLIYGFTPWQVSLSLAQLLVVIAMILAWDGFRRFIGHQPLSPWVLAILTVLVLGWIVVAHLQHSLEARALGNAALIAVFSSLIARELFSAAKPVPRAMHATAWIYAANAAVFLIRIVAIHPNTHHNTGPLNPDGVAAFILLWWLCMIIAITLGMVLMTAERLQADLDSQANRDPLTGALNRRAFSLITSQAIARARSYGKPLSLLIMDLDHFKQINDRLGHDAGDTLLCLFVASAGRILRGEDIFCRFGGEEFVALLPNASAEQAQVAAERLRSAFAAESAKTDITSAEPSLSVTVSIGIAELARDEDIEDLLRRADAALYHAKNTGRNRSQLAKGVKENIIRVSAEQQTSQSSAGNN